MIVMMVVTGTMIGCLGSLGVLARSKPLLTLVISTFTEKCLLKILYCTSVHGSHSFGVHDGGLHRTGVLCLSGSHWHPERHFIISSQERVTGAWAELVDPSFTLRYLSDPRIQVAVDTVQQELRCCGLLIFSEWRDSAWALASPSSLVPDSCCKTQSPGCGERDHPSNIPYTGCAHRWVGNFITSPCPLTPPNPSDNDDTDTLSSRLTEELEKDLSLNTSISFVVSRHKHPDKSLLWTNKPKACLLLVLGVVVTTCHLGRDSGDKRRVDIRQQRAEMVMVKGYWRSKPGSY